MPHAVCARTTRCSLPRARQCSNTRSPNAGRGTSCQVKGQVGIGTGQLPREKAPSRAPAIRVPSPARPPRSRLTGPGPAGGAQRPLPGPARRERRLGMPGPTSQEHHLGAAHPRSPAPLTTNAASGMPSGPRLPPAASLPPAAAIWERTVHARPAPGPCVVTSSRQRCARRGCASSRQNREGRWAGPDPGMGGAVAAPGTGPC